MPNQFIGDIWGTDLPADYWDATKAFNEESQKSAAFGFSFDATQVANEITACTNVVNKYHKALVCGALDPETTLPQFNSELKDAGIDAINFTAPVIRQPSTRSFIRFKDFSSVLLPQPEGPMNAVISFG